MARKNTSGYAGIDDVSSTDIKINEVTNEEVVKDSQQEPQQEEQLVVKKKTNRGRKRKYAEGEVVKLSVLVDKDLSTMLKNTAKRHGTTVIQVMTPYVEKWIENGQKLENPFFDSKNKKYTGFNVTPELRTAFADVCTDRRITQSFVMEALYQKAIDDLNKQ